MQAMETACPAYSEFANHSAVYLGNSRSPVVGGGTAVDILAELLSEVKTTSAAIA